MQKINFQNLPNTTTPINATNLNAIQTNTETAINGVASDVSDVASTLSTLSTNVSNYVDGTTRRGNIKASSVDTTGNATIGGTLNGKNISEIYELDSGTWTPSLSNVNNVAPSVTYTTREGTYFKIGNLVYIEFYIKGKITALNSGDYTCIIGLPYNANSSRNFGAQALSIGILYNAVTVETNNAFIVNGNLIRIQSTAGASATIWKTTTSGTFQIGGSGWYSI